MKPSRSNQKRRAFTLVEVVVVVFVLALMLAMLWPALTAQRHNNGPRCVNYLKQVGLSYRLWAGDNGDKYPMEVSVANGGTMELVGGPDAWKTYQVMSNELSTPKVLLCPQDSGHGNYATNFGNDLKNKISYFIGLDSSLDSTNTFLSGDGNFLLNNSPANYGLVNINSNASLAWDTSRHAGIKKQGWFTKTKIGYGNICLSDGSVQTVTISGLTNLLHQTGLATNRLAIP